MSVRPQADEIEESVLGTIRKYIEGEHPRGRGGKWIDKLGDLKPSSSRRIKRNAEPRLHSTQSSEPGKPLRRIVGTRGGLRGRTYDVAATPSTGSIEVPERGGRPGRMSAAQYAQELAAGKGDYAQQEKRLNRRIRRNVGRHAGEQTTPAAGSARGPNDLSAAEVHFNDAGHISQKTLLAYAEEEATKPTTIEMYRNKDGSYDPSRALLHADIIDHFLHVQDHNGNPQDELGYAQAPDGPPRVVFTGGGYASGKGGMLKMLRADGTIDDSFITIDPDKIKAHLPEFQATAMTDPEANLRVYSEAWDISQEIAAIAREKGLNVVIDGITDSSSDEVGARVQAFTDAGYANPSINYVNMPTEKAMKAAAGRAEQAKADGQVESMRMIPEVIMRSVHRDVSATIPNVMAKSKELGINVNVYDADQGKDEATGQFRLPKLIATADPEGRIVHQDNASYRKLLNKANEKALPGAEPRGPTKGAWASAGFDTTVDPALEKSIGADIATRLPDTGTNPKLPGPADPGEALTAVKVSELDVLRAMLDLGGGVSQKLGAMVSDLSQAGPGTSGRDAFQQVGEQIRQNMDATHVIVGPAKHLARLLAKANADRTPGDVSLIQDIIRGTISVPSASELGNAVDALKSQLEQQGWTVERKKNTLADQNGGLRSAGNGYGMLAFYCRTPSGKIVGEVQINTNPMVWTKDWGPGHSLYEQERILHDRAASDQRPMTPAEAQVADALQSAAKPLYDRAWGVSLNGGADETIPAIVMGDDATRTQFQQRLAELRRQVAAIAQGDQSMQRETNTALAAA